MADQTHVTYQGKDDSSSSYWASETSSSLSSLSSSSDSDESSESESALGQDFLPETRELHALAIASYAARHTLTTSATNDLLRLIVALCPDNNELGKLSLKEINGITGNCDIKAFHYCKICGSTFPEDR